MEAFVKKLLEVGGPEKPDYAQLIQKINHVETEKHQQLLQLLAPVLTTDTMQGFAYQKPHGYAGDFEIIDRIYTKRKSDNLQLAKWDDFFHNQHPAKAVRNRKDYFIQLVEKTEQTKPERPLKILNIGSGPGRDMLEFFQRNPNSQVQFDCVDLDNNAIEYAGNLCTDYRSQIQFFNKNIFRYKPAHDYDLIWSAGLFDYFNNKQFSHLLAYLYSFLESDGELVVGNFSTSNPAITYMEVVGKWYLNHRDENELEQLAIDASVDRQQISVQSEPLGVNLFLHLKK